jgi:SAM-dependent methyltransferase
MDERNETVGRTSLERERDYCDDLYSGFAQQHFAKRAVLAFPNHLVKRMIRLTDANRGSRVLSLGSGTGDTELLLGPHVGSVVGIDISPRGVEHATRAAGDLGIRNASFLLADVDGDVLEPESFDIVIGVFFLHHLPESIDNRLPRRVHALLKPGGVFYGRDPSSRRLSGMVGKVRAKYQTEGEQPLQPSRTWRAFTRAGFEVRRSYYDFGSTPLAGLLPSRRGTYRVSRLIDNVLVRLPLIRLLSSNFEVLAWKR